MFFYHAHKETRHRPSHIDPTGSKYTRIATLGGATIALGGKLALLAFSVSTGLRILRKGIITVGGRRSSQA